MTNGGLGCALLWPFSDERFFVPWRPIPVAPIGLAFLSARGLRIAVIEFEPQQRTLPSASASTGTLLPLFDSESMPICPTLDRRQLFCRPAKVIVVHQRPHDACRHLSGGVHRVADYPRE
jgi:hypothetical protein